MFWCYGVTLARVYFLYTTLHLLHNSQLYLYRGLDHEIAFRDDKKSTSESDADYEEAMMTDWLHLRMHAAWASRVL